MQSLSWAAWRSKRQRTPHHTPRGPRPSVTRRHRARDADDREPRSPLRAYWSVYEITHRAPGSRRAAGSRSTRTEWPRICRHTIFICRNPQRYGKPLKQRGFVGRRRPARRTGSAVWYSCSSNAAIWRYIGGSLRHFTLYFNGATHRVGDAGELQQQAVAYSLDDATSMFLDLGIGQSASYRFKRSERSLLILTHQP